MSYLIGKIHIGNVAQAFRKNLILAAVSFVAFKKFKLFLQCQDNNYYEF